MSEHQWPGPYGGEFDSAARRDDIRNGHYPVAVYGLGKMGVPIASVFAAVTGRVTGVDIDQRRVDQLNAGACPVSGEPDLPQLVSEVVREGALSATTDGREAAAAASIHVVIVPTLVHEGGIPDLSAVRDVVETIGTGLDRGDLVLLESTLPPRTTADVIAPELARVSGLDVSEFGLAFCPERTKSGQAVADITGTHPKIVGGLDEESTRAAMDVYAEITDNEVIPVSDATTAECVKVFEGVYRDVNIALANELGALADELAVDVREAIEAANTQPFCDLHTPGVGVGGHCIPLYPHFLIRPFDADTSLLRTARGVNDRMPTFAVDTLLDGLAAGDVPATESRVLLLGLTYRPGVAEIRNSPALPVAQLLDNAGATLFGVDPVLDDQSAFPVQPVRLEDVEDLDVDAVICVTAHDEFSTIDWTAFDPLVVVDGRGSLDLSGTDHRVYTIGRGANDPDDTW